jgi:hypothetical protein
MNYKKACDLLNLSEPITIKKIKKQYYKLALLYHPDKNDSEEASIKFCECNEAYIYLQKYFKISVEDQNLDYKNIIKNCIKTLFPDIEWNDIFLDTTLNGVLNNCKKISLKIFKKLDKEKALELYLFLSSHKEIFSMDDTILKEMKIILQNKVNKENIIILNPTIDDLLDDKVFKLDIKNQVFLVPLWNYEVCYDISGNDLIIYSIPEIDDNIIIDNENNIIYNFNSSIQDVLNKEFITIEIGNKVLKIPRETLYIKNNQQFIFKDNGILKIDELNLFSTKNRGNIYINITLY